MASTQLSLSFCPNCQTLLDTERDEKVYLKCPSCSYTQDLKVGHLLHSNKLTTKGQPSGTIELPYAMIFDSAVKRTTKVKCVSSECLSNVLSKWGTFTDRGILIQPDTMVINFQDPDRISTYICRVCGNIFRPKTTITQSAK